MQKLEPSTFVKLCGKKDIIYVHAVNDPQGQFHGINLASPKLKISNYRLVDRNCLWQSNTTEINEALHPKVASLAQRLNAGEVEEETSTLVLNRLKMMRSAMKNVLRTDPAS